MWPTTVVSLVILMAASNAGVMLLEDGLQMALLSKYNKMAIPTTLSDPVVHVEHGLNLLKIHSFDHDTLLLNTWVFLSWHDPRLEWNPEKYNNIERTNIFADSIWMPDIAFWDFDYVEQHTIANIRASVDNMGIVTYVPPTQISSQCEQSEDGELFTCVFKAGSWTYDGSKMDIHNHGMVLDLSEFLPHDDWAINNSTVAKNENVYECCPNDVYPDVTYTIELKRIHHRHHHCG